MKKLLLSALILACFSLPAFAMGERLIGTWKSNKEATLQYLKTNTSFTPKMLAKLETVLGKTEMVFDGEQLMMKSGNWTFTSKYKVVAESGNTITVEALEPDTGRVGRSPFKVDKTGFWCTDERLPGYKERFDKVVKK